MSPLYFRTASLLLAGALASPTLAVNPPAQTGRDDAKAKARQKAAKSEQIPVGAVIDRTPPPDDATDEGPLSQMMTTDDAIALFQARVDHDPADCASYVYLGEFLARKAREVGDLSLYARAEVALRHALKMRPDYLNAQSSLASILCDRHKFAEGLELARSVYKKQPKSLDALATMADALVELGRYDEAEKECKKLLKLNPEPSVSARLARLAELRGETDQAIKLLRRAEAEERKMGGAESASWYRVRVGDIFFDAGRIDDAEREYQAVLKEFPNHHDATANLGKVRAAQGRYDEAISFYRKAVGINAEPPMLSALGDLYLKTGRDDLARETFAQLEKIASAHAEYRRELSLYYSQHDLKLPLALELARKDFPGRSDIFGRDALAWALYKNDQPKEAAVEIDQSLQLGTKDARLLFHAGMIHARLGDKEKARDLLNRALAINPRFSPLYADQARQAVKDLDKP